MALLSSAWMTSSRPKNDISSQTRFQAGLRGEENPEDDFYRAELKSILVKAIKKLTEKEQMVISLYYYDELTLKRNRGGFVIN